jgi:hypothetical protein
VVALLYSGGKTGEGALFGKAPALLTNVRLVLTDKHSSLLNFILIDNENNEHWRIL